MNKRTGHSNEDNSLIPVLDEVVEEGETLKQVQLEPWEPESYQPTPLEIEQALEAGKYDELIAKIVDLVQTDIHEQLSNTLSHTIEATLQKNLSQCEERIRSSIVAHLKKSLPDILKQLGQSEAE